MIAADAEFVQESSRDQSKSAAAMEQKARLKVYKKYSASFLKVPKLQLILRYSLKETANLSKV